LRMFHNKVHLWKLLIKCPIFQPVCLGIQMFPIYNAFNACLPALTNSILLTAITCFHAYLIKEYSVVKNWRKYFGFHQTKLFALQGLILGSKVE
jgi:hypothetical protein